uniref:Uncharacterized protein n=1 Tax=Globodera rostochiensis TaxID=31243 RepID=A0A914IBS4_GLORO
MIWRVIREEFELDRLIKSYYHRVVDTSRGADRPVRTLADRIDPLRTSILRAIDSIPQAPTPKAGPGITWRSRFTFPNLSGQPTAAID